MVLGHPQTARGSVEKVFIDLQGTVQAVTRAGIHNLYISGVTPGALYATYYSDREVTASRAVKGTTLPTSALQMIPDGITACLPDTATFSVRWQGLISPARAATYTFTGAVAENTDRVKLLIDQWTSLGPPLTLGLAPTLTPTGTYHFQVANAFYDLTMEYSQFEGNTPGASLSWETSFDGVEYITSERMGLGAAVKGSPFTSTVKPSIACGSRSFARGHGFTVGTVGTTAYFRIFAKDQFDNFEIIGGDR
ncbi:hypothetical protein T484DRAFT_1905148 [Baffinella frigidus]|nr:hypothetical protein T484DRAFT_1905148 [Cryptophyta sp. CCMP2293]